MFFLLVLIPLLIIHNLHDPMAQIISLWLEAKTARSGSLATRRNYGDHIHRFRKWLQRAGLDLDSQNTLVVVREAQKWASDGNPARATYNHRLGIISSFFKFARRHQLLHCDNPADFLDRACVEP